MQRILLSDTNPTNRSLTLDSRRATNSSNTFQMPDHLNDPLLGYGTPSVEYEKIREPKRKARD